MGSLKLIKHAQVKDSKAPPQGVRLKITRLQLQHPADGSSSSIQIPKAHLHVASRQACISYSTDTCACWESSSQPLPSVVFELTMLGVINIVSLRGGTSLALFNASEDAKQPRKKRSVTSAYRAADSWLR